MYKKYFFLVVLFVLSLLNLSAVNATLCLTKHCKVENKTPFKMYIYRIKKKQCADYPISSAQYLPKRGAVDIAPEIKIDGCLPEFLFAKTKFFPKKKSDRYFILSYEINADTLEITATPTVFDKKITVDASTAPLVISLHDAYKNK